MGAQGIVPNKFFLEALETFDSAEARPESRDFFLFFFMNLVLPLKATRRRAEGSQLTRLDEMHQFHAAPLKCLDEIHQWDMDETFKKPDQ
ncbi:hypothetical protein ZIOFF_006905 [Zingiber officinale]|uniref:Uncharacterized protein n=1 Tax=Zingiber officinale TaxID=94328 RepID=A0A8J5IF70_ZINOF|nr:hypothetical protein ZIOFF_006905 [Zingiber officinale]